ncbi:MAG: hypothetical protein R3C14_34285 [Caldilineaceae bacterium]
MGTIGAAAGGLLGESIGLRATLFAGAVGYVLSILLLLLTPQLRQYTPVEGVEGR